MIPQSMIPPAEYSPAEETARIELCHMPENRVTDAAREYFGCREVVWDGDMFIANPMRYRALTGAELIAVRDFIVARNA